MVKSLLTFAPGYQHNKTGYYSDLALIRTATDLHFGDNLYPACVPNPNLQVPML